MKAAIIGMGVVGQANAAWLGEYVHVTYDPKFDDEYPEGEIAECDFAVVCVPTPQNEDGSCDLSYVFSAVTALPETMPVLLRSTVTPSTSELLGRNVVFCPEFIQERPDAQWRRSDDVPFLILGGTEMATALFEYLISFIGFDGRIYRTSPRVAELVKYTVNAFLATKVTFANEMSRICAVWGTDWREVEALWRVDPRTGYTHTSVEAPGGFGGACFPKDLAAIINAASLGEYDAEFLKAVEEANGRFRQ